MKKNYETVKFEIVLISEEDVITTSTAFNGVDDAITAEWYEW